MNKIVEKIHEWLAFYQADSDKADTTVSVSYYDGNVDMATSVLGLLTEDDPNESNENVERRKKLDQFTKVTFGPASKMWHATPEYNLIFIKAQENHFNSVLRHDGFLMLNDVLKGLGLRPTPEGAIKGWTVTEGVYVDLGVDGDEVMQCIDRGTCESIQLTIKHHGIMYNEIAFVP